MSSYNTIDLDNNSRTEELLAVAAISPGYLCEKTSAGKVQAHSSTGGAHMRLFAREDSLQGDNVDTAYAADDIVSLAYIPPGNRVQSVLGLNQTAVIGSNLISGGDGTLIVADQAAELLFQNVASSTTMHTWTTIAAFDVDYDIPKGFLKAGDKLRIKARVNVIKANSTDTVALTLRLGGTTIIATAALNITDNDTGLIEAEITIRTVGASGTMVAGGTTAFGVDGTATAVVFALPSTAIDTTTADLTVDVAATASVSHADNQVALDDLSVELLRTDPTTVVLEASEAVTTTSAVSFIEGIVA
ncbi:MAG: hypothetical protein GY841_02785 [FCB group bacterium]|nr:hypothetical protein [FCB group bacterium]